MTCDPYSAATQQLSFSGHDPIGQQVLIYSCFDRARPSRFRQSQEGRFICDASGWRSIIVNLIILTAT